MQLYVQGRGYLQRFDRGAENIDLAIDALGRAMAADPSYALAHTALGETYWRKYESNTRRDVDRSRRARTARPRWPSTAGWLRCTSRWPWSRAGAADTKKAIAVAQRAIELDPVSSEAYRELGRAQEALNRLADAEATYRKAIEARRMTGRPSTHWAASPARDRDGRKPRRVPARDRADARQHARL